MELMDIYDNNMEKTGKVKCRDEQVENGEYHLSVHLWNISNDGKILIQKRSKNKKSCPGKWSVITGGVIAGETPEEAVKRECLEEIQASVKVAKKVGVIKRQYDFVNIFVSNELPKIEEIVINEEEIEECKIVDFSTFEKMIEKNEIIDSVLDEYYKYIKFLKGE